MELTPSQTVGPFYDLGLIDARWAPAIEAATPGERIRIEGRVLDGDGAPVVDGMLESWQADAGGIYRHPRTTAGHALANDGFTGFQRISTTAEGIGSAGRPSCRAPSPSRMEAAMRPISISGSSPAACSTGCIRGSISPARR